MSAIGTPMTRREGRAKVTGSAQYTADTPIDGVVYGVFATTPIARGRTISLDVAAAERATGVIRILTSRTMPKLGKVTSPPGGQSYIPLQDDRICYEGQPIALAVATTLEEAQHAASLVRAEYASEEPVVDFRSGIDAATVGTSFAEPDTHVGDIERALAESPVRIEQIYLTADRHHACMEPSATLAHWEDGTLTLYDTTQGISGVRTVIASVLGIKPDDIHVRNLVVGGAFGCKGYVWPHEILTAAAARVIGRPLKVVLTRAQTFVAHGYQAASEQRVALGATRDGRLVAIRHQAFTPTSRFDGYVEYAAISSRALYACPNIQTTHRIVAVDRSTPTPMRAPHEGPASVGLECAMDELAHELQIDPVELRLRNYAERDPTSGKPFSSKELRECYRVGADRFGWSRRNAVPRSMREAGHLVGWGMATATMQTFRVPSSARISLRAGGTFLVESGTQEIGTGLYTIVPQIAADVLGVPAERVELVLGDTRLPEAGMTAGSSSTMGVGSAVHDAATRLKARLTELTSGQLPSSPGAYDALLAKHGAPALSVEGRSPSRITQRIRMVSSVKALAAEGRWSPGPDASPIGEDPKWSMHTWGAVFVEVRLDEDFMIPRVTRVVGVYSAGRIVNPTTARSQMVGGLIWGVGQALLEHSAMDRHLGRYVSKNLAGYLVPVNADIPDLDVQFVDERDPHASAIGARGIGELAAVGIGPAIANAVWHATGVRVRELPIRPEHLL